MLESLKAQAVKPYEVIIVLRRSGDGSEGIIESYSRELPIKVVEQREGNFAAAYELGIREASGDVALFMDDDAVAEQGWVEKYISLFENLNAGALGEGSSVL